MEKLFYTNEFLKKLEPIIVKNDLKTVQKIKETLAVIAEEGVEKSETIKLENQKTKTGEDVFITEIQLERRVANLFWTIKKEQTIIITFI
jgi:hypothetical protein